MPARADRASPLAAHPVFRSRDLDGVHAFLASKRFDFELSARREGAPLDVEFNGVYMPNAFVGFFRYGAAATVAATPERDDYWLQFAGAGTSEIRLSNRTVACGAGRAVVISGARKHVVRCPAGHTRIQVVLPRDALVSHLAALLDAAVAEPLEFDAALPIDEGPGRAIAEYVRFLVRQLGEGGPGFTHPILAAEIEQTLMSSLLLLHRHNYSAALERPARPLAPRDVRRAIDYIRAHLDRPLTMEALVQASGVAGRTLQKHFRAFEGVSPLGYARRLRFERARDALLRGDVGIGDAAARWGFQHLGRFAAGYRRMFGEAPSQTRARRRP